MWISKAKWDEVVARIKNLEERCDHKQNVKMGVGDSYGSFWGSPRYPDYILVEEAIRLLADKQGLEFVVEQSETKTVLKPKAKSK